MGKKDSSLTRCKPVFDELLARDKSGQSWLPQLLTLPRRCNIPALPLQKFSNIESPRGVVLEGKLKPPMALLKWLIENVKDPKDSKRKMSADTFRKRMALYQKDKNTREEAYRLLKANKNLGRAWYVFEGNSSPDVFIETPEVLVVIEGKRTEHGPTTSTTWMSNRYQLLRHLDCAWEIRGSRAVFGFFIVEGGDTADDIDIPKVWQRNAEKTVSPEALQDNLPHRTEKERKEISASFLGVTTWQRVCKAFNIDWNRLPKYKGASVVPAQILNENHKISGSASVVNCKDCGQRLEQDAGTWAEDRLPCPQCGSMARSIEMTFQEDIRIIERMGLKSRYGGGGKPSVELVQCYDLHRDTKTRRHLSRVIDRRNNQYEEIITDPVTGKTHRECREPLSEHRGHGAAKLRRAEPKDDEPIGS